MRQGSPPDEVATAFKADYRSRLGLTDGQVPAEVVAHASTVTPSGNDAPPFHVDDWTRSNPYRSSPAE